MGPRGLNNPKAMEGCVKPPPCIRDKCYSIEQPIQDYIGTIVNVNTNILAAA